MNKSYFFKGVLMALFIMILLFSNTRVKAQTTEDLSGSTIRAAKGDTVWVLLNHIKHDKRQQFEKFIHEIFWPKAAILEPSDQQAFRQTRVLHPVKMNKDSTYTYIFLMDPLIPNKSYKILNFLKKMYGEEKANKYYAMFKECYASPQTGYVVVQSQY